ncbi:Starch-binding associating with outer membrane [Prevotella sp. ne3005]|uniref:RagB/SusD family nutrient uptake outer membrane protein n=1 Tax=Prevotella sp. ne3005 TaxID=1761887 RepID=UPI0008CD3265|nr:RagB/SusD family nutrient uptake outer membrane protein [Prevotella sp. ne3005]SEN26478.1 Starch-binding associating with outer membrane [Prevotella sp. ne3005]
MKKIFKYFAMAGLGLVALSSCNNEDYLDVPKYDILDISSQYEGDDNARLGLNGIYAYNNVSKQDNSWGYKPNLFTGSHPTMDTQCTGWDVKFLDQTWDANVGELGEGWAHAYAAICRANLYLSGLETAENVSPEAKNLCEGEARALRGYFYTWLATTFGRVPMLATGEDFSNTPNKAAADTYEEMWDFIIEDFSKAAELLNWTPYENQYGRCTKGMAKAYLADAYMWKAFRCPDQASDCYNKAKAELKSIIDSGTYKLATNFATNWDPAGFWNEECIWAMCSDEGNEWSSWGGDRVVTFCNPNMFKWFTACPENGGWGSQYLSWEWYSCYEPGDTRRDASCVTGAIPEDQLAKYGIEKSKVVYGFHPYLKDSLGIKNDNGQVVKPFINAEGVVSGTKTMQFHFTNGEFAPAIWTTKIWRNAFADGNSWGTQMWSPTIIYGKRYANVLLDYAECCFRTGDETTGWAQLDILRNRAWGNLTIGQDYSKYFAHFNTVYTGNGKNTTMTEYPIGVLTQAVTVPSAKEYYTKLQATPNRVGYTHKSEAWKVAVNEERRKEFNSEWCLCPDMIRSGYMEDHIDYNYPKDDGGSDYANYPWSKRSFDFDINKMDMPIPAGELLKNTLLKQNPGY